MKAKRFLSILLAVMLAFSCVAITASADDTIYTLNIYLYETTESNNVSTNTSVGTSSTGTATDSSSLSNTAVPISGVSFLIYKVDDDETETDITKISSSTPQSGTYTTNSNGLTTFTTTTPGRYLVVVNETTVTDYMVKSTNGYVVPFLVDLPSYYTSTDSTTGVTSTTELDTVTVYPKTVVTGAIKFTKSWNSSSVTTLPSTVTSVSFQLKDSSGNTVKVISDGNGIYYVGDSGSETIEITSGSTIFYVNGLEAGTYYLYETNVVSTDGTYTAVGSTTAVGTYVVSKGGYAEYNSTSGTVTETNLETQSYMNRSNSNVSVSKTVQEVDKDGNPTYTVSGTATDNYTLGPVDIDQNNDNKAEWKISVNLPSDIASYESLIIYDKISTDYLTPDKVTDWVVTNATTTLTYGTDYTITASAESDTGYTLYKIEISDISSLVGGTSNTLDITFCSTITADGVATIIPNLAIVSYINASGSTTDDPEYVDDQGSDPTDTPEDSTSNDPSDPDYYREPEADSNTSTTSDDPSIYTGKIVFTKIGSDDTSTALTGATFALTDSDGNTYTITESSGVFTATGLPAGTYTLTETVAPTGYNKVSDITFTISATNLEETFTSATSHDDATTASYSITSGDTTTNYVVDIKQTNLPLTGGTGLYLIVGLGLALVAVGGYMFFRKKRTA